MTNKKIKSRLEYIRGEIEAERVSYGEIAELQSLVKYIDPADILLLEWAGVPEKVSKTKNRLHVINSDAIKRSGPHSVPLKLRLAWFKRHFRRSHPLTYRFLSGLGIVVTAFFVFLIVWLVVMIAFINNVK